MEEIQVKQKKNGKRPGIKVLDVVIILMVLLVIVGIYFRYNTLDFVENNLNKKEYTISFSIKDIRYTTPDHVAVGHAVYLADSGDLMGTLIAPTDDMKNIALKCTATSKYFSDGNGKNVEVIYPADTRVDAEGKMTCEGLYTSDGIFLLNGTTHLAAGKTVDVKTEKVTVTITVENIAEVEAK